MGPCLNSENLFEENGVGGEENVPSNNLECGDDIFVKQWRNKGVDKAAGREENVPTGEEEEDTEHWKRYTSEESWGRYEKDKEKETEANPSGLPSKILASP